MSAKSSYKRKIKRKVRRSPIILALLVIIAAVLFLLANYGDKLGIDLFASKDTQLETAPVPKDGEVLFHVMDVGQGDSILVTSTAGNMLIDTSESSERGELVAYLDRMEIESFEYVVFTHPDADHIGNAEYIVQNYKIKSIIMPDFAKTTKMYENMLDAIEAKKIPITLIGESEDCEHSGYTFYLGSLQNTVIAPIEDINNANDMSIVIKSTYGDTSIMLTGDAEEKSEEKILEKWGTADLDCDVLKIGHHGAKTSTTQEFLDAVSPTIALISCGVDNTYEHPHGETLDKLSDAGIKVYRTDKDGDIVLRTDGVSFTVLGE